MSLAICKNHGFTALDLAGLNLAHGRHAAIVSFYNWGAGDQLVGTDQIVRA